MKNSTVVSVLVASGLSMACGASLTMEGMRVKVALEAESIAQCQPISAVEAVGSTPEQAQIIIRNKAGTMSANTVFVSEKTENDGKHLYVGKTYNCKNEGP